MFHTHGPEGGCCSQNSGKWRFLANMVARTYSAIGWASAPLAQVTIGAVSIAGWALSMPV